VLRDVSHGVFQETAKQQDPFHNHNLKGRGVYLVPAVAPTPEATPPHSAPAAPAAAAPDASPAASARASSASALELAAAAGVDVEELTGWLAQIGLARRR
jgi:pyruvate/2-oxoglutarate dehydrogenase complex dihydrolipoamide acyltransferase (E2) component